MRKEIIFAIIAGVIFGLVIAVGIWRANSSIDEEISTEQQSEQASPTPQRADNQLAISKPEQNQVITQTPVEVNGITKPNSWVAISAEDEEYIIRSSNSGEFYQMVDLEPGINRIVITSFNQDNDASEGIITVVYSSQFGEEESINEE